MGRFWVWEVTRGVVWINSKRDSLIKYTSNNGEIWVTYKLEFSFPAWSYANGLYTFLP